MTENSTRPQLDAGIVDLGERVTREGEAMARLGRAMKNPRSTLANIMKLAEEAGYSVKLTFDRDVNLTAGPEGLRDTSRAGVLGGSRLERLQSALRNVGELVSLEWLSERSNAELEALEAFVEPDGIDKVVRPSFLPQIES